MDFMSTALEPEVQFMTTVTDKTWELKIHVKSYGPAPTSVTLASPAKHEPSHPVISRLKREKRCSFPH